MLTSIEKDLLSEISVDVILKQDTETAKQAIPT
jgi:uncharacterized protein YwbE